MKSKNPMLNLPDALIEQIEQVTEHQIDELILLVCQRFHRLRPEGECSFLVLSKDPVMRCEEIEFLVQDLMNSL